MLGNIHNHNHNLQSNNILCNNIKMRLEPTLFKIPQPQPMTQFTKCAHVSDVHITSCREFLCESWWSCRWCRWWESRRWLRPQTVCADLRALPKVIDHLLRYASASVNLWWKSSSPWWTWWSDRSDKSDHIDHLLQYASVKTEVLWSWHLNAN